MWSVFAILSMPARRRRWIASRAATPPTSATAAAAIGISTRVRLTAETVPLSAVRWQGVAGASLIAWRRRPGGVRSGTRCRFEDFAEHGGQLDSLNGGEGLDDAVLSVEVVR